MKFSNEIILEEYLHLYKNGDIDLGFMLEQINTIIQQEKKQS